VVDYDLSHAESSGVFGGGAVCDQPYCAAGAIGAGGNVGSAAIAPPSATGDNGKGGSKFDRASRNGSVYVGFGVEESADASACGEP
jgi:hypothetical protein